MIIKSDNKTNNFMIKIKNYISTQRRPGLLLLGLLLAVINHFYIVEHNGLFGLWVYILAANIMGASLYRYLDSYHPFKISIIAFIILIGVSFVNIYTDSKTTTPIPLNNENIQMIDVSEKMIITVDPHQYLYFNVWLEFLVALIFLLLLILGWGKRKKYQIPASFLIFASFAYLLPTLTGTFSSLPRYVLACFPAFMVLEKLLSQKRLFRIYFVFSILGFTLLAAFFFRGYWVA